MDNHAPGAKAVTIGIDWKTGISAKDWESVARKEKIEVSSQVYIFHLPHFLRGQISWGLVIVYAPLF